MRLAVALVCLGGCSLSLSRPDPRRASATAPQCDTSKSLVAFDGVLATGFGIGGLALASDKQGGAAGGMIAVAALYALSAARGSSTVDECRAAFTDYERAVAARDAAPPPTPQDGWPDARPRPRVAPRPTRPPPPTEAMPAPPVQEPVANTEPTKPEVAKAAPAKPEVVKVVTKPEDDPAFHISAGTPERAPRPAPAKPPKPTPQPPPPDETWRDFWREVP